ncbi:MAG: hypothetical protein LBM60_07340, partial [Clostridium sp.]|nr:hypothetical protein [Clostridium sp.]
NLTNINANKVEQDKLSRQMSSKKKISRPSEDPVVAIRALRLRNSVSEITQYYSKNIPDATNWLELTEDSLDELSNILDDMGQQCTKGANGELTSSDREVITAQLKELQDAYYACGNSDMAGRYLFTGLRTDTPLRFLENTTKEYTITQQMDLSAIDEVTVVGTTKNVAGATVDLMDVNADNYDELTINQSDVTRTQLHRVRLAYKNCDDAIPADPEDPTDTGFTPTLEYYDTTGTRVSIPTRMIHSYEDPYSQVETDPASGPVYIPETGEILLDDETYQKMMATKDNVTTQGQNESEIRITYQKTNWNEGELRPEHYFYCESPNASGDTVLYNEPYLSTFGLPDTQDSQSIAYDVGFSQSLQINITADQCFHPGINRDIDDLVSALESWKDLETVQKQMQDLLETAQGSEKDAITARLDALGKAITFQKDKVQRLMENELTRLDDYLDDVSLCITECGTRSSKLSLIEKRALGQKTSFDDLASKNEDIDVTEVALALSSAEFTYNAALMATGKVMQTSLINYI